MIKSMTGFGKYVVDTEDAKTTIEIRTLNSKNLDINCRIPIAYKELELKIRNLIGNKLERGKIDCSISRDQKNTTSAPVINLVLAEHYIEQMKGLSDNLQLESESDYLANLLKLPDVIAMPEINISKKEADSLMEGVTNALQFVDEFRINEGKSLLSEFTNRIKIIENLLIEVEPYELSRLDKIKHRIKSNLSQLFNNGQIDNNRFEQEVIYYLEKLDITEEKTRLKKHCEYFLETLNLDKSSGKKLGFIGQEIGREINTLGSKANDADIQKIVVLMKDELEKIKEQLFNIL
jgi:uncharacterized protein (TIGR00255 family)